MEYVMEENKVIIKLEGELNSFNSEQVEKDIDEILSGNHFESIVLDAKGLRYISSAGLRIVARLKQQYNDVSIIHTQDDVYSILEMVGFTEEINVIR